MELDQRVKALEYEVKILKNEIQRTLLEIHEQILNHYYPALRTEETAVVEEAVKAIQVEQRKAPPAPAREARPIPTADRPPLRETLPQAHTDRPRPAVDLQDPEVEDIPVVKKVTLEAIRGAHEPAAPATVTPLPQMGKLIDWALTSAAQVGNERAVKIIGLLGSKGLIDADTLDVLLQVTPLNRRNPTDAVTLTEIMSVVLRLQALLNREADVDETTALIKEAHLG